MTLTQSHRQNQEEPTTPEEEEEEHKKNLKVFIFLFFPSVRSPDCYVKLWDNSPYFLLQSCRPFRDTDDKILRLLRFCHKKENYSDRTSKNKAFKSLKSKKGTSCEHFRTSEISSNLKRVKVTWSCLELKHEYRWKYNSEFSYYSNSFLYKIPLDGFILHADRREHKFNCFGSRHRRHKCSFSGFLLRQYFV